jgi:hypothetical protein
MKSRRRFTQPKSLQERLRNFANDVRARAEALPASAAKDELTKARQADTASHLDEWVNSPGLQSPK